MLLLQLLCVPFINTAGLVSKRHSSSYDSAVGLVKNAMGQHAAEYTYKRSAGK